MASTQTIGELIAEHMLVPSDVQEPKPEAEYIASGLRAAIFVNPIARRKILTDIAKVLGCESQDLEFLFSGLKSKGHIAPVRDVRLPDYRHELMAAAE